MGSLISAIAGAIEMVISAIVAVIMAIIDAIVMVILAIWNLFLDILCCRCGSRRRTRTTGTSRRRWGRRGGVTGGGVGSTY